MESKIETKAAVESPISALPEGALYQTRYLLDKQQRKRFSQSVSFSPGAVSAIALLVFLLLMALAGFFTKDGSIQSLSVSLAVFCAFILGLVLFSLLRSNQTAKRFAARLGMTPTIGIGFYEDRFISYSAAGEKISELTVLDYARIKKIKDCGEAIVLVLANSAMLFVRKADLGNDGQAAAFVSFLETKSGKRAAIVASGRAKADQMAGVLSFMASSLTFLLMFFYMIAYSATFDLYPLMYVSMGVSGLCLAAAIYAVTRKPARGFAIIGIVVSALLLGLSGLGGLACQSLFKDDSYAANRDEFVTRLGYDLPEKARAVSYERDSTGHFTKYLRLTLSLDDQTEVDDFSATVSASSNWKVVTSADVAYFTQFGGEKCVAMPEWTVGAYATIHDLDSETYLPVFDSTAHYELALACFWPQERLLDVAMYSLQGATLDIN